jgi:type II secretory pathway pseudopilin PulG
MATERKKQNLNSREHGAVLIVSLLVLLVLTLLGISSLDNSVLEEKMASNAQTSTATFQQAESAIRQALIAESPNPAGAVGKGRVGESAVDRSANGITSSSQLIYNPNAVAPYCEDSGPEFRCPDFQIAGSANVGNIRNRNIQGFRVTNVPHFE